MDKFRQASENRKIAEEIANTKRSETFYKVKSWLPERINTQANAGERSLEIKASIEPLNFFQIDLCFEEIEKELRKYGYDLRPGCTFMGENYYRISW